MKKFDSFSKLVFFGVLVFSFAVFGFSELSVKVHNNSKSSDYIVQTDKGKDKPDTKHDPPGQNGGDNKGSDRDTHSVDKDAGKDKPTKVT